MSEPGGAARGGVFVPASFEDLRRNTRAESEALERRRDETIRSQEDFVDFVAQRDFMKTSKRIAVGGMALGGVLILAAYVKPMFETVNAMQTAAATAKSGAQKQLGAVGRIAGQAQAIKDTDTKAIDIAKGGLGCLTGKAACAGGASSPFK